MLCQRPIGFVDQVQANDECILSKSLYDLHQGPHAWFSRIVDFLRDIDFVATLSDSSLLVLHQGADTTFLLLYVDDMVLSASTKALLQDVAACLQEFVVKDMGPLRFSLGVDVPALGV